MAKKTCTHTHHIRIRPARDSVIGCEDCLQIGSTWVHLRMCLTCGHVGCCDSSLHQHARQHFNTTQHPIIQSVEPGEKWGWCYWDEVYLKDPPLPNSA